MFFSINLLILAEPSSCDETDDDFEYTAVELENVVATTVGQVRIVHGFFAQCRATVAIAYWLVCLQFPIS